MNGLTLEPAPSEWALPDPPAASPERAALGLPETSTVIMLGHQAAAWHAGIAVKFYLARAMADALTASGRPAIVAWLTPDHVAAQPFRLRVPVLDSGRLAERALDLAPALPEGGSVCAAPASSSLRASWDGAEPALEQVRAGVESRRAALSASADESNAARQAIGAMQQELGAGGSPDIKLYASELSRAGALDGLIDAMLDDPEACARTYNEAATARPDAGIGAMTLGNRTELPLWELSSGRPRRVFADELADLPRATLAPRALTMTLLARRSLCEVFIHGTGGGAYDPVMEAWARRWLGATALAPMIVASVTRTLPLGHLAADDSAIDRAAWRAHAARHDPALLGDDAAAAEKRKLVGAIRETREAGGDPSALFAEMQALLARVREERAGEIESFRRAAVEAQAKRGAGAVANDRTWALALHDERARAGLVGLATEAASVLTTPARSPR